MGAGDRGFLYEAAQMVCERYDAACVALLLCADADLKDRDVRSCAAVASVIHLRAMDAFFTKPKQRPDDVISADFIEGDFEGATTPMLVRLGNKRIAHITSGARESRGITFWDPRGHLALLVRQVQWFIDVLERLHPERAAWFRSTHDRWSSHPLLSDDLHPEAELVLTFTGSVRTYRFRT